MYSNDDIGLNQIKCQCILKELKIGIDTQLSVDIFTVLLHRVPADTKRFSNLRIVMIPGQQKNYLDLPLREGIKSDLIIDFEMFLFSNAF